MLKHHRSTLLTFSDAETPLSATRSLSFITETPLPPTPHLSPITVQQPFTTFSHFLTILHRRNNTVQQLFRLFFSVAETPFQQPFETPLFFDFFLTILHLHETTPSNNCFAFSFLLLKHHCQQLFIIFPDAETPLFNTFYSSYSQNTTVRHFLTILHRRNNTVQQLFRPFLFH
jgi:hypothetical protein